jgi:hypothetical protein
MAKIKLNDLAVNQELDASAMNKVTGGAGNMFGNKTGGNANNNGVMAGGGGFGGGTSAWGNTIGGTGGAGGANNAQGASGGSGGTGGGWWFLGRGGGSGFRRSWWQLWHRCCSGASMGSISVEQALRARVFPLPVAEDPTTLVNNLRSYNSYFLILNG